MNPMTEEELDELFTADPAGGNADFQPLETGAYDAVCVGVVCKRMPNKFKNGELQDKFNYIFQIVEGTGENQTIYWLKSRLFTRSSNENATLVKDIIMPWTGASLERIQSRFKMRSMLGYPAQLVVSTSEHDGKTYNDVTSIIKPKKNASRVVVAGKLPYYLTKDSIGYDFVEGVEPTLEAPQKKDDVAPVQGLPGGLAEGMQANFQAGQPVNDAAPDFGLATPTVPQNKMPQMPPAAKVTQAANPAEFMGVTNPPAQPQTGVVQEDDDDSSDLPF